MGENRRVFLHYVKKSLCKEERMQKDGLKIVGILNGIRIFYLL